MTRSEMRQLFELTAGQMPRPELLHTPIPFSVLGETVLDTCKRYEIRYSTELGSDTRAFLFVPKNCDKKRPAVLCPHQTNGEQGGEEPAGISGLSTLHYAAELADRGYVTLAPDAVYFGKSSVDPYALGYESGTMKQLFDHMRGIDLLSGLNVVDPARIGCIGHSLGGHNTIFAALYDERIKVAVSSCGICSHREYVKTNIMGMAAWAQDKYMPKVRTVYDNDPEKMPWDYPALVASLAPCAVFLNAPTKDTNMNYPGQRAVIEACVPVYKALGLSDRFAWQHPDAEHSFPQDVRKKAYDFIDSVIGI